MKEAEVTRQDDPKPAEVRAVYQIGYAAAQAGAGAEMNPHEMESWQHTAWAQGWGHAVYAEENSLRHALMGET